MGDSPNGGRRPLIFSEFHMPKKNLRMACSSSKFDNAQMEFQSSIYFGSFRCAKLLNLPKIENKSIIKKNAILTNGTDTSFINYENHIYIFTAGYLEYYG